MIKSINEFIIQFHGWSFPIDLEKICDKLNIKIKQKILPKYLRAYYDHKNRTIFINSNLDKTRARFYIAMEIRQAQYPFEKISLKEKREFALELLLPTEEFLQKWNSFEPTQIIGCAMYFDITSNLVISKFKNLQRKGILSEKMFKNFSTIS